MKSDPEIVELNEQELYEKLDQVEAALGAEFVRPLRQLLAAYITLLALLREKHITIRRLRKIIFGSSSERSTDILPPDDEADEHEEADQDQVEDQVEDEDKDKDEDKDALEDEDQEQGSDWKSDIEPSADSSTDGHGKKHKKPPPGHGRIPASAYTGCKSIAITHESFAPGDCCPGCAEAKGTLYRQADWAVVVRLKGQTPVTGKVYQLERLRCHLCGEVYTATLPEQAGPTKYDPTVASTIAALRYGEGLPWNRIQRIQKAAGIPLPASTQWELVRDAIPGGIQAAYDHLLELGAQGELFHKDDTSMCVLELEGKKKRQEPLREDAPQRRGVYTTSVLSRDDGRPTIALFFTGPYHAGENLRAVLAKRQLELPRPIQMCDALSSNMPDELHTIIANCLAHGRRKFVEVIDYFESEVKYVIQCLKTVYKTDADARKQQLSPDQRRQLHQKQSQPVMDELHDWLKQQFDEKKVEPNSSLGGAISYMLNHWDKLTLFLRVPGAPLDNNLCEQALKMAIRHRKNSLFYKTMRGAEVGDLYMSLIHTCYFCDADPFDYLTQLQRNEPRVIAAPGDWMPWNYRQQLDSTKFASKSNGSTVDQQPGLTAHPPDR